MDSEVGRIGPLQNCKLEICNAFRAVAADTPTASEVSGCWSRTEMVIAVRNVVHTNKRSGNPICAHCSESEVFFI